MLPFDAFMSIPVVLLIVGELVLVGWLVYEHRRVDEALDDEETARLETEQSFLDSYQSADKAISEAVDALRAGLNASLSDLALREHSHPYSPETHDHTGGTQGHVHWMRYSSTEVTDSLRRDVYVCLVPDCKAIFAHTPGN